MVKLVKDKETGTYYLTFEEVYCVNQELLCLTRWLSSIEKYWGASGITIWSHQLWQCSLCYYLHAAQLLLGFLQTGWRVLQDMLSNIWPRNRLMVSTARRQCFPRPRLDRLWGVDDHSKWASEIRNIEEIDGKLGWICLKNPVCNWSATHTGFGRGNCHLRLCGDPCAFAK
jgi:hypothetical protein